MSTTTTTVTTTTTKITPVPPFIAKPGGKYDYVTFTVPHSYTFPGLLAQVCSEINYEILSGEAELCRDVRAHVVQTEEGEYITISNLHDNHKKYFDKLFIEGKNTPNELFESLLKQVERGIAVYAQKRTPNHPVTVYRSSDWLHV